MHSLGFVHATSIPCWFKLSRQVIICGSFSILRILVISWIEWSRRNIITASLIHSPTYCVPGYWDANWGTFYDSTRQIINRNKCGKKGSWSNLKYWVEILLEQRRRITKIPIHYCWGFIDRLQLDKHTPGMPPLNEWLTRRKGRYLHNLIHCAVITHNDSTRCIVYINLYIYIYICMYTSTDKQPCEPPSLSYTHTCNVCGRNLLTGLTSAASPRMDISSTCNVGQRLGVPLPLLTCSPSAWTSRLLYRRGRKYRKDLRITLYNGYCTILKGKTAEAWRWPPTHI